MALVVVIIWNECMGWVVWYEECAREPQSFPTQEVNEWRLVANAFPSVRRHVSRNAADCAAKSWTWVHSGLGVSSQPQSVSVVPDLVDFLATPC